MTGRAVSAPRRRRPPPTLHSLGDGHRTVTSLRCEVNAISYLHDPPHVQDLGKEHREGVTVIMTQNSITIAISWKKKRQHEDFK